jgi:hypothetical protein
LCKFWDRLAWPARALWACRISLLSGLAGLFLFGFTIQGQNLFADRSCAHFFQGVPYWLAVFFLVFAFWALPIHYNARRALKGDAWLLPRRFRVHFQPEVSEAVCKELRRRHASLIKFTPHVIAFIPFIAILLGLRGAQDAITDAGYLREAVETQIQLVLLMALDVIIAVSFFVVMVYFRYYILRIAAVTLSKIQRGLKFARITTRVRVIRKDMSYLTILGAFLILFAVYAIPEELADYAPRAMLVPVVLGSLVLFLGWLARVGDSSGVPLLTAGIAIASFATALNVTVSDVRTLELPKGEAFEDRQIDFLDALNRWKLANGCVDSPCPPALILAAEGGASRAAFMTATAVGHLIDREGELGDPPDLASPGRRIFAISGVSGGAFGAVVIRAAIEDSFAKSKIGPPCVNSQRNWFSNPVGGRDVTTSWRSCLQLLVSGDYLSSAFVGFGLRDILAPPFLAPADRAALLERAWERHYNYVTSGKASWRELGRDCEENSSQGLCRRFGYAKDLGARKWAPLLLLNGTSVNSGQRIIVSDLVSTRSDKERKSRVPLYSAAFDYFEMTSTRCLTPQSVTLGCPELKSGTNDVPKKRDGQDIRLSTAGLMSARFPIVSPAGVIRAKDQPGFGDRVVDGGYFENAGLKTAFDVANALKDEGVTPFILRIQNEPITPPGERIALPRAAASPPVTADGDGPLARVFGLAAVPVESLIATRSGHAAEEAALVDSKLYVMNSDVCPPDYEVAASFYQIGVEGTPNLNPPPRYGYSHRDCNRNSYVMQAPEDYWSDPILDDACKKLASTSGNKSYSMVRVSMSWWLSAAVQADLDAQLCDAHNRETIRNLMGRLRTRLAPADFISTFY